MSEPESTDRFPAVIPDMADPYAPTNGSAYAASVAALYAPPPAPVGYGPPAPATAGYGPPPPVAEYSPRTDPGVR